MSKIYKNRITIGGKKLNVIAINYKKDIEINDKETKVVENIHHIHVLDRSYSMSRDIDNLIDNVIETFKHIGENDMISVVWFSDSDKCKVLFKGATIHSEAVIIQKLNSIRSCNGCTCFSEPLRHVKDIMEDLGDICPNFNISFFTDGCTCTNWSDTEEKTKIFEVLTPLTDKILSFNTIGYGSWYDEELLIDMSKCSMFGRFTHSKDIKDYSEIFKHEYENIKDVVPESVEISSESSEVLYTTNRNTKLVDDGIKLSFLNKSKNQFFIVTESDTFSINGISFNVNEIKPKISKPTMLNFFYAYAKELYYKGNQHKAIDVLVHTGDKFIIDSIMNAFTRDERSEVTTVLNNAFINNKTRMKDGEVGIDYIPKEDAFNVIDFLSELTRIPSEFIPVEDYNRIGKKVVDEFNLFRKDLSKESKSDMNDLIFNEKKLNVSIKYIVYGFVSLNPKQASKLGLEKEYPTIMYRTQTIIKDGSLNIPKINVRISRSDLVLLNEDARKFIEQSEYCSVNDGDYKATSSTWTKDTEKGYYILDLTKLPITNRSYSNMDIEDVLDCTKVLVRWKARQKAIKTLLEVSPNELKYTGPITENITFNEQQISGLLEHGLNNRLEYVGVDNKVITREDGDFYESRSIEFGIKGCSSIPKVADSLKKEEDNKKLNLLDIQIVETIHSLKDKTQTEILNELQCCKSAISIFSTKLFSAKVSKVLTGGWWNGLEATAKDERFTKDDTTLIVKTKREKVYL